MKKETELERRKRQAANFMRQGSDISPIRSARSIARALEEEGFKCTTIDDEVVINIPADFTLKDRNKLMSKIANL